MNVDELSTELQVRASTVDPGVSGAPATNRVAGVRRRIQLRRRRQAATAVGLTAVCVAAVGLAPTMSGLLADPAPLPASQVAPEPLNFAAREAGAPLLVEKVSRPGETTLVLEFTPADTNLSISSFCSDPGAPDAGSGPNLVTYSVMVNGNGITGSECGKEKGPNGQKVKLGDAGDSQAGARAAWADLDVLPGKLSRFEVIIEPGPDRSAASLADLRIGLGLYLQTGPQIVSDGVTIDEFAGTTGNEYRLAGHRTLRTTGQDRLLSMQVPATTSPVRVLFGAEETGSVKNGSGNIDLLIDGVTTNGLHSPNGGAVYDDLPAGPARTIAVRVDAAFTGTLVIGYYLAMD